MESNSVRKRLLFLSPSVASGKERECVVEDFESISNRAIGEGAFGQVFKVRHIKTGGLYAIKMISKSKIIEKGMLPQLRREVRIMYSLDHPYIIKLHNHFEDDNNFYLILQLAEGGSLFNKLVKVRTLDEIATAQYMREIALAVQYLHTREPPIIHRDIKPENIFLDKDGNAKLGDFGWSSFSDSVRSTYCGTLEYLAPEMIDRTGHDTRLDIWNLGILLFELLTGNAPFQSKNQEELFGKIKRLKVGFTKNFPQGAKELVRSLLRTNPDERITIKELLEHPWIVQIPPLRKTCEMTTVTEKLPEDMNIPENQYKVISKADDSHQLLIQEKILSTQLRTKLKKYENEIHQLEGLLRKNQEKEGILETEYFKIQENVSELKLRIVNDSLYEEKNSFSDIQEDLDDKIVKIQVRLRKNDFEMRMKLKEATEKRKNLLSKEIKNGISETLLLRLKSYYKELKWLHKINKTSYYVQELKKIIDLIKDEVDDNIVKSCLEELNQKFEAKLEIQGTLVDLSDTTQQKSFTLNELEESMQELREISQLKTEVYKILLPKKQK